MPIKQRRKFRCVLNGKWIGKGIAYGPQRDRHTPTSLEQPTRQELYHDLRLISQQWHFIRVYRTSQTTENILRIIREENLPIRVLLGLWVVENEGDVNREHNRFSVNSGIRLAKQYQDEVIGVSVGNEIFVQWSAHCIKQKTPVVEMIQHIRRHIIQPITVADDYNFWNKPESKQIVPELDFLTLHVHPAWNGKSVEEATAFVRDTYRSIQANHPDIPIVLGECGWPTDYNPQKNGPDEQGMLIKGEVSEAAQATFYQEYMQWIEVSRIPTLFFEAFDEIWKGGGADSGPHEVEKHWGVFTAKRKPKAVIQHLYPYTLLQEIAEKVARS
jgi:exo-beta-1,3-glucanase (GH17 family)